jgi:hypothetical protein
MQKKHLHALLLLLFISGCGRTRFHTDNPYFINFNDIIATPAFDDPACLSGEGVDLQIVGRSVPVFEVRLADVTGGFLSGFWQEEPFGEVPLPHRDVSRTLTAVLLDDSAAGLRARAVLLPSGNGISLYLEGRPHSQMHFVLQSASKKDSLLLREPRRMSSQVLVFERGDGVSLAIAATAENFRVERVQQDSTSNSTWSLIVGAGERRQIILVCDADARTAQKRVQHYLGWSPERMEREATAGLRKRLIFSLHTEDAQANRVFAALASAVLAADSRQNFDSPAEIQQAAQMTAARFLASRAKPDSVPGTLQNARARRERLRWSTAEWRAALAWGMDSTVHLEKQAAGVVGDISRLQLDYKTDGWPVFADETISDTALRALVAEMQHADLLLLAEEISLLRGDRQTQGDMRRDAMLASRAAHQRITNIARRYRDEQTAKRIAQETLADSNADLEEKTTVCYPDTALFLQMGAAYGFQQIGEHPALLWNPRLAVDGFTWQKWVAFRFRNDVGQRMTSDFDSLTALLLDGPVPGMLTENPRYGREPSVPVMAAAFENLATIYLGMQPNAMLRKLTLEPRPPTSWGRTQARIPYAEGFITLDLDFAHRHAYVGQEGLASDVDVVFGYPLDSGGFLRGQFTLEAGKHPVRIELEKQKDNMQRLRLDDVP